MENKIITLVRARNLLQSMTGTNAELDQIACQLNAFIEKHCDHEFVYDLIDISPECSKTVSYCSKCERLA